MAGEPRLIQAQATQYSNLERLTAIIRVVVVDPVTKRKRKRMVEKRARRAREARVDSTTCKY